MAFLMSKEELIEITIEKIVENLDVNLLAETVARKIEDDQEKIGIAARGLQIQNIAGSNEKNPDVKYKMIYDEDKKKNVLIKQNLEECKITNLIGHENIPNMTVGVLNYNIESIN